MKVEITIEVDATQRMDACMRDGNRYFRDVQVEPDDEVLAYCELAESYTRIHELTAAQVAEARRLAALVRSGSHHVCAGWVRPSVRQSGVGGA